MNHSNVQKIKFFSTPTKTDETMNKFWYGGCRTRCVVPENTFVLVDEMVFNRSNDWMIKCLTNSMSDELKEVKYLRWLLEFRKLRSLKNVEILQVVLVLRVASWQRFFPHFHYEIIFCYAELFECTFSFKFC